MPKIKRIKEKGKIKLFKDVSIEKAVAEIQEILAAEGKIIRNKIKAK